MDQDQHEFLNRDVISMKGVASVKKESFLLQHLTEGNRKIKVERKQGSLRAGLSHCREGETGDNKSE